jgi:hypothetical protein
LAPGYHLRAKQKSPNRHERSRVTYGSGSLAQAQIDIQILLPLAVSAKDKSFDFAVWRESE